VRQFIALLGSAAARARARRASQHRSCPFSGFCASYSTPPAQNLVVGSGLGLKKQAGREESHNVAVDYARPDNQIDRLPALVDEILIGRPGR